MPDIEIRLNSYGLPVALMRGEEVLAENGGKPIAIDQSHLQLVADALRTGKVSVNGFDQTSYLTALIQASPGTPDLTKILSTIASTRPEVQSASEALRGSQEKLADELLELRDKATAEATANNRPQESFDLRLTGEEFHRLKLMNGDHALPAKVTADALRMADRMMAQAIREGSTVEELFFLGGVPAEDRNKQLVEAFRGLDGNAKTMTREELASLLLTYASSPIAFKENRVPAFESILSSKVSMPALGMKPDDISKVTAIARQYLGDNYLPSLETNTAEANAAFVQSMTPATKRGRGRHE